MEKVSIRVIDFISKADKETHGQMVTLVERNLGLHQRRSAAQTPAEKERLQRQIDITDQEIDRLVYDLYGLTEEEIKIVEVASVASTFKMKENAPRRTVPNAEAISNQFFLLWAVDDL